MSATSAPAAATLPPVLTRRRLAAIFALWTGLALLFAIHTWLGLGADGRGVPLLHALYWSAAEWYTWALLTPLIFVACRFIMSRHRTAVALGLLAVFGLAMSVAQIALEAGLDRIALALTGGASLSIRSWLSGQQAVTAADFLYLLQRKIGFDYFVFWVIALIAHAVDWYTLYRTHELESLRLDAALTRSRLDALQAQLQPHFLFNTLNAISALVRSDPAKADRMIGSLSDMLRSVLDRSKTVEVPLAEELALVDAYVAIETARFGDRLDVHVSVDDSARRGLVPPLVLQPLVENAVRHGVATSEHPGRVDIVAYRSEKVLVLEVFDDGPGPRASKERPRSGVGLSATRARLEALHGDRAELTLDHSPADGTRARVTIPWRTAEPSKPDDLRTR
jgi:signal transduction histidine kinase